MSDAQELFNLAWPYMAYIVPTIFLLSVIACADLIYSLLVGFLTKARRAIRM